MLQVPYFKACDSWQCLEALALLIMLVGHQGGVLAAIKVVIVIMTF